MLSLLRGAALAKKDIQKQIPLFKAHYEIVLFSYNDYPSRKAAEKHQIFQPHLKPKIACMNAYKDASE